MIFNLMPLFLCTFCIGSLNTVYTPALRLRYPNKRWSVLSGDLLVNGVQLGNIWIGVQPPLGVEGDPMRLLFERDLTPHPQYAAFYLWLQHVFKADAALHFGMHGTVEWLPGAPLGSFFPEILQKYFEKPCGYRFLNLNKGTSRASVCSD